ncbi:MAG: diguanylate cyclase [Alphaproteobacteria bacterium]|nr:diguanylate cyclase [Alphaproteobacteria bacterium]
MKITPKSTSDVGAVTPKSGVKRAQAGATVQSPSATKDVASVLGIPEAEFTPRVRDAIMSLMAEVDRLRQELEAVKRRLDTAEAEADQDGLVPALNRRAFVREMSRIMSFGERYDLAASLIYVDLDGFKAVNDTHGHAAGDAALMHVANLLIANVRESDVVGRLGGDEFGVILAKADLVQAQRKAGSLATMFEKHPFEWEGKALPLSFAFGVCMFQKGESVASAMANADKAMYASKREKNSKKS